MFADIIQEVEQKPIVSSFENKLDKLPNSYQTLFKQHVEKLDFELEKKISAQRQSHEEYKHRLLEEAIEFIPVLETLLKGSKFGLQPVKLEVSGKADWNYLGWGAWSEKNPGKAFVLCELQKTLSSKGIKTEFHACSDYDDYYGEKMTGSLIITCTKGS